ncbi:RluA family pseudouridine synthase [Pelovirga terrestris]|uniref:Pseudouridine synthase n=1 Tax=Pelovirga terrestris TaxID=2771352 RepID=A0A8J6QL21_9BACT|nr:RluA family pseudouridine synthase [Pelovirga terrestris]MBD1400264.1 RluA family pseudouridine synthase [Pelovirga terrestris]
MTLSRQLVFPYDAPAQRIDAFLADVLPDISRAQLKKLIDHQQVTCDGAATKAGVKLKGGETIEVLLPPPEPSTALAEDIPLHVLYEDQDLIVINKPAGMVVHPATGNVHGTLVNALLHHCDDLAGIGGTLRPGIVHRIDKDTSGVLVVTKNDQAHQHLAEQFHQHSIKREYLALIHGHLPTRKGTIDQPLGRHPVQRKKFSTKARHSKRAVTHWYVVTNFSNEKFSLIRLQLETGRTHQIRVHLSESGHPLVGDPLYGRRSELHHIKDQQLRTLIRQLPGQALHAHTLGFIHPRTGEYLEFSSDIPAPLRHIIAYLEQSGSSHETDYPI